MPTATTASTGRATPSTRERNAQIATQSSAALKGDPQGRIVRAIHAVACGDTFLAAGVAPKTVSNTLSAVYAKLGVTNRTEAALRARDAGLGGR
jgi:DNA-binding NarL/FixJ family response regulator